VERLLFALGFEALILIFAIGLTRRIGVTKHRELSYDWLYFLRVAVTYAVLAQISFIILVSALYWKEHSMAVGLAALVGIPMVLFIMMVMMQNFARIYRSIPNLIRRLEQMTADEREYQLERLPPEIFIQLPGDYRFVTKKSEK
jgi:hypothetical protein